VGLQQLDVVAHHLGQTVDQRRRQQVSRRQLLDRAQQTGHVLVTRVERDDL
jgi:hypothetical protein